MQSYGNKWVSLEGTIFTYRNKYRGEDYTAEIPIELLSLSYTKKFDWMRLIWAIVSTIIIPAIFFLFCSIFYYYFGNPLNLSSNQFYGTGFFLGFLSFLYLAILFFKRVPVAILTSTEGHQIEISLTGKHKILLKELLAVLEKRKADVLEKEANLLQFAKTSYILKPVSGIIGQIILFSFPWLILHKDSLIFLCLLPIVWHGYRYINYFLLPKPYRQYYKSFQKQKYPEALEALRQLLKEKPDYGYAYKDYIELLGITGNFPEAFEFLNKIGNESDPDFYSAAQDHILWCQKFWERKKEPIN